MCFSSLTSLVSTRNNPGLLVALKPLTTPSLPLPCVLHLLYSTASYARFPSTCRSTRSLLLVLQHLAWELKCTLLLSTFYFLLTTRSPRGFRVLQCFAATSRVLPRITTPRDVCNSRTTTTRDSSRHGVQHQGRSTLVDPA